jgi:hypothetical protein
MKSLCTCSLALCCCFARAETNTIGTSFSPPPLQLRQLSSEGVAPESAFRPQPFELQADSTPAQGQELFFAGKENKSEEPQLDQFELDSFSSTESRRIYARLDNEGFFERPLARSENLLDRALDSIVVPEPIKLGKVTASCSVYTAIKRRNPLCLINPMFIHLAW